MEEVIEEERAKVDAKTPITEEVFRKWKYEHDAALLAASYEAEAERRRKGTLTGREIFAEEGFIAQDDASASDAYTREVDEEAEIKRMHEEAAAAAETARAQAGEGGDANGLGEAGAGGQGAPAGDGAGLSSGAAAGVQLTEQEEEDLFGESDEDDDEDGLLDEMQESLKVS